MMHQRTEKNREKHWGVLVFLAIFAFISVFFLADRLMRVTETSQTTINLVTTGALSSASGSQSTLYTRSSESQNSGGSTTAGFEVSDNNQVWSTNTQVDIFKTLSNNAGNPLTRMQSEEDKIIAPGMSNIYSFKLDNTGGMTVDYQMDLEVWLGNEDYSIPLDIRLSDENGNYLAGSADSWQSVSDMDRITDAGVMDAGSSKNYTLEWQWLFEEDNERDTTLGNQAVDDDITLTVSINTTAMADDGSEPIVEVTPTVEATPTVEVTPTVEATPTVEPTPTIQITPTVEILPTGDVPPTDYSAQMSDSLQNGETVPSGELPKTGDESPIIFYLLLALGAVAVLIVLLVLSKRKKQKIHSAALRRVMMVVFSILLGYNAYLANARGLAGNQIPMPFGVGFAVVLSGSMEPTLSTNDVLVVREAEDYNVGDIVVYQSGYELIVHRIISVDGDTIITQGDANNVADSPIEKSAIKGIVIAHVPAIGVLFNILKTPTGILLILICAFLMMELSFRSQRASDDKELGEMKEEIRRLKEEQKNETDRKD